METEEFAFDFTYQGSAYSVQVKRFAVDYNPMYQLIELMAEGKFGVRMDNNASLLTLSD